MTPLALTLVLAAMFAIGFVCGWVFAHGKDP
jgi:hypothetical protein